MIRILTGPIRNYKTTTLLQWSSQRGDVGGILTPDVDGIRHLYNVKERSFIPWQTELQTDDRDLVIGRFVFDHAAFQTAVGWLDDHLRDAAVNTIILDEIGPLELKGMGWDAWMQRSADELRSKDVIIVIRQSIVEQVIERYGLQGAQVMSKEDFAFNPLAP